MTRITELPDGLAEFEGFWNGLTGRIPAVFLDYDGVLTPIVDDPAAATLDDNARGELVALSDHVPVAIVSGRDLDDVRRMVGVDSFVYAGSHGFDILLADGTTEQYGTDSLPDLDAAQTALEERFLSMASIRVERKRFAIAVHSRGADDADVEATERAVKETAGKYDTLRVTGGKDIQELRPDIDWDKGKALRRLVDVLELDMSTYAPIYMGDDLTDEDGYAAVAEAGTSVVVAGERDRSTIANYRLDDPEAVHTFLRRIRERTDSSDNASEQRG